MSARRVNVGGPPLPLVPPCNRQRPFFVAEVWSYKLTRVELGYVEWGSDTSNYNSGLPSALAGSSSVVVLLRRRISGVSILHLALTHWPRKDRAPPGRFFAPSPLRFIGARPACDGVGQANGKSLLLFPGPTIETEGLFLDVFHQDRAGACRELRGPQHAFNDHC